MEEFDKRIREKLEEVRPPLPTNAWASFKQLMPLPWYAVLWNQYSNWLMGGLFATGLAGSLIVIYKDKQTIQQLNEEISTLKNTKKISTQIVPRIIENLRVDTVYVIKREVVHVPTLVASSQTEPILSNNAITSTTQKTVPITHEAKKEAEPIRKKESESPMVAQVGQSYMNMNQKTEATTNTVRETTIPENKAPKVENEEIAIDETETQKAVLEQFKAQFGEDTTKTKKNKSARKPFKLPKMFPRLGLETAFTDFEAPEISPMFELTLADNFSISSGISVHQTQEERYPRPPDFNKATGKDFVERYQPKLPKFDRIEEISVSTTSVRLPIFLKYYIPFKKGFSFVFSTGTALDLSIFQSVKFESYFQGVESYRTFEDKAKAQRFSSFIFGSGIQYQRGRIIGQVQPFFDYNFRKVEYRPDAKGNIGLKAGIFIDLSKK